MIKLLYNLIQNAKKVIISLGDFFGWILNRKWRQYTNQKQNMKKLIILLLTHAVTINGMEKFFKEIFMLNTKTQAIFPKNAAKDIELAARNENKFEYFLNFQ